MSARLSAVAIAAAVQKSDLSAVAVAQDVLQRLADYDEVQPQTWISRFDDNRLLEAAAAIDAAVAAGKHLPLAGVPFAAKDNIDVVGLPTTAACPAFAYQPERHAFVVQRLLDAGALCVGKTNLDQFATGLVGTRSPYGAPRCVYNLDYVSGGSSSGSAVATAAGLVAFALGTDTAGSGRVPAAFNHLVGLKPSKGRWSTSGLVPACRTLDCITVLASSVADARLVDEVVAGFDAMDDFAKHVADQPLGTRIGVPLPHQRNFCGDAQSEYLYRQAIDQLHRLGHQLIEIDIEPLRAAAALLYQGPWVAERTAAVGALLQDQPEAIDPVVRDILTGGMKFSAVEAFRGQYSLAHMARKAQAIWDSVDVLALPTTPTIYRLRELQAAPLALNSNLGLYTNFVNLLDMAAIAVPAGFRSNGTGFGISFIAPAGSDRALLALADRWMAAQSFTPPDMDRDGHMEKIKLAVVGAHLKDMPLHWQLTSRDAVFVEATTTAPTYKLYAMANSTPPKPALIHDAGGAAIAVEIYELSAEAFGSFTADVPAPLAIGTVTLADGRSVKGFVAEPRALIGAQDITAFGGWRAYCALLT
jgi:allophanate hydrolase